MCSWRGGRRELRPWFSTLGKLPIGRPVLDLCTTLLEVPQRASSWKPTTQCAQSFSASQRSRDNPHRGPSKHQSRRRHLSFLSSPMPTHQSLLEGGREGYESSSAPLHLQPLEPQAQLRTEEGKSFPLGLGWKLYIEPASK